MEPKHSLVKLYNDSHSLVRHHLDSFNHFIDVEMDKIVKTYGRIEIASSKFFVQLSNIKVENPAIFEYQIKIPLYPQQCRIRNLTYAADITVDIQYPGAGNKLMKHERFVIGRIPIMLRSNVCNLHGLSNEELTGKGECQYDTGGYFITKGTERVFLMQEQMAKNRMIIEQMKITKKAGIKLPLGERVPDKDIVCHVTSYTVANKSKTTVFRNSGYFYVQNTLFHESVPLFVMFAAFNVPKHKDIMELIGREQEVQNELISSCEEAIGLGIFTQRQALLWLIPRIKLAMNKLSDNKMTANASSLEEVERSLSLAKQEIIRRVLNHVPGSEAILTDRAQYLGLMTRRILLAEKGQITPDDRDSYGIKRLEMVGTYLGLMFEDKFQSLMSALQMELTKTINTNKANQMNPTQYIRQSLITEGMFQCIFTGNWNLMRFTMSRSGVTQVLNRLSYLGTLGHLGRISSQFEKVRKITGARAIHLSQHGFVCVADTPEGEACGLVKNLAFLVEITVNLPTQEQEQLEQFIKERCSDDLSTFRHHSGMRLVMLNGVPVGWTYYPKALARLLRKERREGHIHSHVSIYYESKVETLHVCCDGGRMVRPYIILEQGSSRFTRHIHEEVLAGILHWDDLIRAGIIEYIDALEGYAECLMAYDESQITPEHTHLDIDPATALGVVASLIPFPHHNQSPRNTYQCAMGKQALGVISTNQNQRCDGTQHKLLAAQRPLTMSHVGTLTNYQCLPAGQNAIVAILCFGGYDIEDAIVINKNSLERGLLRSLTSKCFTDVVKDNEFLAVPTKKEWRQRAIDEDGLAGIGSVIKNGDVVISKIVNPVKDPVAANDPSKVIDPKPSPTCYFGSEPTNVVENMITFDGHYGMARVKTSQMRQPEVGDKLSSRHGQKGVISKIVPMEEMPFTEDGLVPDIIMNPHGFPSRMTVGKLIELLANKGAVMDGNYRDSSAFSEAGHKSIGEDYQSVMLANGFSVSGKEVLMSDVNNGTLECDVYMGPVFYQRLKHMVQDKVHARDFGKNQQLTRQPNVGRSNDGGLRVGEMERDCLIGYGASQILKERMLLSSDPFRAWVCEGCGLLATSKEWCQMCRSSQHISSVVMPYATKLLLQELMTIQITPRLSLSRHETAVL